MQVAQKLMTSLARPQPNRIYQRRRLPRIKRLPEPLEIIVEKMGLKTSMMIKQKRK
jgi:hypothetical protein